MPAEPPPGRDATRRDSPGGRTRLIDRRAVATAGEFQGCFWGVVVGPRSRLCSRPRRTGACPGAAERPGQVSRAQPPPLSLLGSGGPPSPSAPLPSDPGLRGFSWSPEAPRQVITFLGGTHGMHACVFSGS